MRKHRDFWCPCCSWSNSQKEDWITFRFIFFNNIGRLLLLFLLLLHLHTMILLCSLLFHNLIIINKCLRQIVNSTKLISLRICCLECRIRNLILRYILIRLLISLRLRCLGSFDVALQVAVVFCQIQFEELLQIVNNLFPRIDDNRFKWRFSDARKEILAPFCALI